MFRFCTVIGGTVGAVLLALAASCVPDEQPNTNKDSESPSSHTSPAVVVESPSTCAAIDSFSKAIDKAQSAANLAQSAQSSEEWNEVVLRWTQAIEAMQSIPPSSPKRSFAEKKVNEYLQNLVIAQQKVAQARPKLPFASFNNQLLDEQVMLYLSYVAAVGPPDVVIVGSSRGLQGVDPGALQQALAKGRGGLKVFNFGVNGATAQGVDFLLRQLLSKEQLPQLILWADGARAFNSGRVDRTFSGIVASPGYRRLLAGFRPTLPVEKTEATRSCKQVPNSAATTPGSETVEVGRWADAGVENSSIQLLPSHREIVYRQSPVAPHSLLAQVGLLQNEDDRVFLTSAIDANGFLPVSDRFSPATYYRRNPRVSGRYDADYRAFNLAGEQAAALNRLLTFTKSRRIPVVIVNLPLTQDYLDPVRRRYEQQFGRFMQRQASETGFVFIDLGRQWQNRNGLFADPSHLNRYGAAAVSNRLAADKRIPWPRPKS